MSNEAWGLAGFAAVLALIMVRVPIGIAMGVIGAGGTWLLGGFDTFRFGLGTAPFNALFPYSLSVLPLFIMMGVFAAYSGMSRNLFVGANAFVGHRPGGLAVATIGASAMFGAVCGSSLATAATMSKVALPEMKSRGYGEGLATGAVAAGGTLGIMIPPSIPLALYGLLTQTSIGALYAAAILPGLLGAALYMSAVWVTTWRSPAVGPAGDRYTWRQRVDALVQIWDVLALFVLVLGGLFLGWFSPTEAAAVGVAGAVALTAIRGRLTREFVKTSLWDTALSMGLIFLILIGAGIFGFFIDLSGLPQASVAFVQGLDVGRFWVLVVILVGYLILGCLLDSLSMLLLTIPIFFPIVMGLDFWGLNETSKAIWFGILALMVVEIGLITPPVGMNVFIINSMARDVPMIETFRGVAPFLVSDFARVALLLFVPAVALVALKL